MSGNSSYQSQDEIGNKVHYLQAEFGMFGDMIHYLQAEFGMFGDSFHYLKAVREDQDSDCDESFGMQAKMLFGPVVPTASRSDVASVDNYVPDVSLRKQLLQIWIQFECQYN